MILNEDQIKKLNELSPYSSSGNSISTNEKTIPLLNEAPQSFDIKDYEERDDGTVILKGILQKSETLNHNKRIYPHEILVREVDNYQRLIKERRSYGECDHPDSVVVELQKASHIVTETWWSRENPSELWGRLELLDTPMGELVKSLVRKKCTIGVSSRGLGSTKLVNGQNIVQDDFMLVCWDIVSEPSTPNAFVFKEHREVPLTLVENYFKATGQLLNREIDRIMNNYNNLVGN